jgi:hypothetical protein
MGLLININIVPEFTSSAMRGAPEIPRINVKAIPKVQRYNGKTIPIPIVVVACSIETKSKLTPNVEMEMDMKIIGSNTSRVIVIKSFFSEYKSKKVFWIKTKMRLVFLTFGCTDSIDFVLDSVTLAIILLSFIFSNLHCFA